MKNSEKSYQEALDYIYSFIDYSLTRNLRYSPEKFNLDRMFEFMDVLGNPQKDYKVIHVAGTKGKGSTAAMLNSILSNAGYKAGFYSSPHMVEFTERIRIGSQQISKSELAACVEAVKPYVAKVKELTTFEIITGIAFKYFLDKNVDFAIIEVGMGGRLDATNIVSPLLTVITTISHDHMKILGSTLPQIAREKAGIIKEGIPVVVSEQQTSAKKVIEQVARSKNAKMIYAKDKFVIKRKNFSLEGQSFTVSSVKKENAPLDWFDKDFDFPLLGNHQLDNARTALACVNELQQEGYSIEYQSMYKGLNGLKWPGRFEVISKDPLIIIDGAHNRDSFRKLKEAIDLYLSDKQKILIFGASEDKEVKLMLSTINPSIDRLIVTKAQHPRALESEILQEKAREIGIDCDAAKSVEESIELAVKYYTPGSAILAAGSIFIAGAVKEIWRSQGERKR